MFVKTLTRYKRSSSQIAAESQQIGFKEAFFSNRILSMWNDLPETVVNAKTVKEFEKLFDLFWKDQPFKFDFLACYQPL